MNPDARAGCFIGGQIVVADWRVDARMKEPNKLRPGIVVEDDSLFAPEFTNVILVPLSRDAKLVVPDLTLAILPTPENGCPEPCWAISYLVMSTAKDRLRPTPSCITNDQLAAIRRQIALAVGVRG